MHPVLAGALKGAAGGLASGSSARRRMTRLRLPGLA
jgi:hypothetical protein